MDFNLLYNQKIFNKVDRSYARSLFKDSTLVSLFSDEYLFHHGTLGRGVYFVVKGSLHVVLEIKQADQETPKEFVLDTIKPYSCFGEVCFLKEQPRITSVKATEFSECIYLDRQVLTNGLRHKDINAYQLSINLGHIVAERMGKLNEQVYELCKDDPSLIDQFANYL